MRNRILATLIIIFTAVCLYIAADILCSEANKIGRTEEAR